MDVISNRKKILETGKLCGWAQDARIELLQR